MRKALLIVALAIGMTAAAQQEKQELLHMCGTVVEKKTHEDGFTYILEVDRYMNEFIKGNIDLWVLINEGEVTTSWERTKYGSYIMSCIVGSVGYAIVHTPDHDRIRIRIIYY